MENVCRNFMRGKCDRERCKYIHDGKLCVRFWKSYIEHGGLEGASCKFGDNCRKKHNVTQLTTPGDGPNENKKGVHQRRKHRNTECFVPMTTPVDMRVVYDVSTDHLRTDLTTRDVLIAPNVFNDFGPGELYERITSEISNSGVPKDQLLKLWHGNDKILGTHLIANDRTHWKDNCPTFNMVVQRIAEYFRMDVQATRFNWYTDTSQWKPFHHDSAYVNPEKAAVQNFTVAVSFGATRDAAFEHAKTKAVISIPVPDGGVYAFAKDTNAVWRHGILQESVVRNLGRISVICWGWVDNMGRVAHDTQH